MDKPIKSGLEGRQSEALRHESQPWRNLAEALPHLICAATPDGTFDYFSPQWRECTGVPESRLLGWRWLDVLHPDDRKAARQGWTDSIAAGGSVDLEYRVRRADGSYGWFKARGQPVRDGKGNIAQWVGICTEIDDRKQAEEAWRRSEQELRQVRKEIEARVAEQTAELRRAVVYLAGAQRLSRTGSFGWKVSTGDILCSEETFRIFHYDPTTKPTMDLVLHRVHPEDGPVLKQTLERASRDGRDFEREFRILIPDGSAKHIHIVAHAARSEAGGLEFIGAVKDVTAQRQAEARLRESEQRYRRIVDTAFEGILVSNEQNITTFVNRRMAEMLGYEPEDMLGRKTTDYLFEEDLPAFEKKIANSPKGISERYEHRIRRRDGRPIWVHISATPVFDPEHRFQGSFCMFSDISERKTAEEELRKHREDLEELVKKRTEELVEAKERAEAANRAKSIFLASMSHELRTPLNVVLGFSRLMKNDQEVPASQKENLDIIVRSGEHLLNLINNVLDISKIESGRVALEESEVDLRQLLHELHSEMGVRAAEKGLTFTWEQSPSLPRRVVVDADKLRQVLINLISNATRYTERGGLKLRAEAASSETPQRVRVRFEVEDSGQGIGEEDLKRIFFPFVQLGSRSSIEAGTGLGLAISKQYVELMGGQIDVASEPGKGSVFKFTIPVVVLPGAETPSQLGCRRITGLAGGQPRFRLLIAEDHLENRLLLRKLFEPLGFDLREAVNGQQAVAIFEEWRPDLIWMDIRMPVVDGLEAARRIKAMEAGRRTKIVALTAHALEEEIQPILEAGCDDLVRKPYREQELFEVMARQLDLEYLYENDAVGNSPPASDALIPPEQWTALPPELLEQLHQAAIELDTARTLALVERVAGLDAAIGSLLKELAGELDYPQILRLLEKTKAGQAL